MATIEQQIRFAKACNDKPLTGMQTGEAYGKAEKMWGLGGFACRAPAKNDDVENPRCYVGKGFEVKGEGDTYEEAFAVSEGK